MLTREQNDLLCRVEGDAPMGGIMRRHWLPVCLSEEVADKDGAHTARLCRAAAKLLAATTLATDLPDSQVLTPEGMRAIKCPVLAVYGAESDMVPQAGWLEAALPDCRSTFVPGQEHSVLVLATDAVRELFLDWLCEQGVAARGARHLIGCTPSPNNKEGCLR